LNFVKSLQASIYRLFDGFTLREKRLNSKGLYFGDWQMAKSLNVGQHLHHQQKSIRKFDKAKNYLYRIKNFWALLNLNMKFKNQLFSTLTLCDSASLRDTNSYFHSATPIFDC
jgi:hypothetical protein